MEYYKAWRLCLYQDFSITTLLSPRGLKDDGEKNIVSRSAHTLCPELGCLLTACNRIFFLQARCEIKKNRNAPIYITVHCELLLRSLAESNRSNWFCRPVTKPLIQVTNCDCRVQKYSLFSIPASFISPFLDQTGIFCNFQRGRPCGKAPRAVQ